MAPPLSHATMSMNNFSTAAIGNLSSLAPPVGFLNPSGTRNLSATAAGVSMDEFNQLKVRCDTLEVEVRELRDSCNDFAIKINGRTFSLMQEFVTFYNQDVL